MTAASSPYQPPPWAEPPPSTEKRKTWLIAVAVAIIRLLLIIGGWLAITPGPINAADEALSETSASLEPENSSPSPGPTAESSDQLDDTGGASRSARLSPTRTAQSLSGFG